MAVSAPTFRSGLTLMPYVRGGVVVAPSQTRAGWVRYDPVLALDLSAEWYLDGNTSLLVNLGWAHADWLFVYGPSFALAFRSVLPDTGPRSTRRHEEQRVRRIDRRWQRARTDAWNQRFAEGPHAPGSMLRSRNPVPGWVWSLLGASEEWQQEPEAAPALGDTDPPPQ
jgi:hypothetical protein